MRACTDDLFSEFVKGKLKVTLFSAIDHLHPNHLELGNDRSDENSLDSDDDLSLSFVGVAHDDERAVNNTDPVDTEDPPLPKFLFKIKEENKLTQKSLQQIAIATRQLVQGSIERIKRKAENCLLTAGINSRDVPGFDDVFLDDILDCNNIQVMASNVETYHKKENCNIPFVVSITFIYFN